MKNRYLKILQEIPVHSDHEVSSPKIDTLQPNQIVPYNREKRRNRVNWMEIYLENDKVGYIKKEYKTFFKCDHVTLNDEKVVGFNYTQKITPLLGMTDLFFAQKPTNVEEDNIGEFLLESIEDSSEDKRTYITLYYRKDMVDVELIEFKKHYQFYIVNDTYDRNDIFIEVDNFHGKKGFLLKKTNYSNIADKWMSNLAIAIAILVVVGIFLAFLASGWIVISGLMVLAGFVVAFILIFVLQIVLMILRGIFNQIRKRF